MELDCIVIGYNDIPFTKVIEQLEPYKDVTCAYEHMRAQSVLIKGKRLKYSELIQECISHSTGKPCDLHVFRMPSLGVNYLVNFLRKNDLNAEAINFFNYDKSHLRQLLENNSPKAVALSTTCYVDPGPIREIVEFVRRYNNETIIIVGGPYINSTCFDAPIQQQDWVFETIGADIFIHESQGELTLSRLCRTLKHLVYDLEAIPNLIYLKDGKFHRTFLETESNDLDEIRPTIYPPFDDHSPRPAAFIRTSRSCPNKCAYCRYPILGGKHVLSGLTAVQTELDYLYSRGIRHLVFVDDNINIPLHRFKELCRILINNEYDFKWFAYFRCSHADDETFDLMKKAGCVGVVIGIDSADAIMLENMNRKMSIDQYEYCIKQLNYHNIITLASIFIGFPGETDETARKTLRFIHENRPTFYTVQAYYHETKLPIARKSKMYGLTGDGYNWSHSTMNWKRASELVSEGIQTITGSTFLPFHSFNLWSWSYYMSQGITKEQMIHFTQLAAKIVIEEYNESSSVHDEYEKQILSVFKEDELVT